MSREKKIFSPGIFVSISGDLSLANNHLSLSPPHWHWFKFEWAVVKVIRELWPWAVEFSSVWVTPRELSCHLETRLHAVGRLPGRSWKPVSLGFRGSQQGASVRWSVCTACVHLVLWVRLYASITGFPGYWMASLTHLEPSCGRGCVALSLCFGNKTLSLC